MGVTFPLFLERSVERRRTGEINDSLDQNVDPTMQVAHRDSLIYIVSRVGSISINRQGFARDAYRVARFQREAKLLASLNHPNIAAIYGRG